MRPWRPEWRWGLLAAAALAAGSVLAEPYARWASPAYAAAARLVAAEKPWEVAAVGVHPGKTQLSSELQLEGVVRRRAGDDHAAARTIGRVQVGEVIETPLVFWTLLLGWPSQEARWALRISFGVICHLLLETVTTTLQLLLPMAQASSILASGTEQLTGWDRWSRFLEAGGQFALAACAAIIVAVSTRRRRASTRPLDRPR